MFETGKAIKTFTSKKANQIMVRYPKWEDLDQLVTFINTISKEDTFITFSGEEISKDSEMAYLTSVFTAMEKQHASHLYVFHNDILIGNCQVARREKRHEHIGRIGITVGREYREEGIGTELLSILFAEAKRLGFAMVDLMVYGTNDRAYHLYQKMGFQEAGRMPGSVRYKDGFLDEIWMYRIL